jgi:3-hydroxyisobutyrate dehydrogenase-like beta-hydroxyacid dehydrogenase
MKMGIVGLGSMGKQIALQLLLVGHQITVWNRSIAPVDELVRRGAKGARMVSETLQGDLVLSILFDDDAIRKTFLGSEGGAKGKPDCIHVCTSTVSLAFAEELQEFHDAHRLSYVSAPMLGRPEVIEKQGLNFLVGGDPALLDRIEPVLTSLGKMWRIGSNPINGQVAKLAANFMISGAIEAMAEAAALLRVYGADAERFFSVMGDSLFSSFIYRSYGPMVAGRAPATPSGLSLPLKDNLSFLQAAEAKDIQVPLAKIVRANLMQVFGSGGAAEDWSTALGKVAMGRNI